MPFNRARRGVLASVVLLGSFPVLGIAEDMDPKALVNQMSEAIAGLDSFRVDGDAYADWRLPAGLIIENASEVTARVRRRVHRGMTLSALPYGCTVTRVRGGVMYYYCGGIWYKPSYSGTTVVYIVDSIDSGASTEVEFEE